MGTAGREPIPALHTQTKVNEMSSIEWDAVLESAKQAVRETSDDRERIVAVMDDLIDLPYGWDSMSDALQEMIPFRLHGKDRTPAGWDKFRKAYYENDVATIGLMVLDAINDGLSVAAADAVEQVLEGRDD